MNLGTFVPGIIKIIAGYAINKPTKKICAQIKIGNFENLKWLIENSDKTILHSRILSACTNGNLEMIKWIVERFNIGAEDFRMNGHILLSRNCSLGNIEVVKWLVEKFSLTIEDIRPDGYYILRCACMNGQFEITKYLIKRFHISNRDVEVSIQFGDLCAVHNIEILTWLVGTFDFTNKIRMSDNWILRSNCFKGKFEIVKLLIERFNFTAEDVSNNYVLRYACRYGELEMVKWLVERFNITSDYVIYNHIFELSCEFGCIEVAKFLFEKFLTIEYVKSNNNRASRLAKGNGHTSVVKWLGKL